MTKLVEKLLGLVKDSFTRFDCIFLRLYQANKIGVQWAGIMPRVL